MEDHPKWSCLTSLQNPTCAIIDAERSSITSHARRMALKRSDDTLLKQAIMLQSKGNPIEPCRIGRFQRDGVTCRLENLLEKKFYWAHYFSWSYDLTLPDFALWGYVKLFVTQTSQIRLTLWKGIFGSLLAAYGLNCQWNLSSYVNFIYLRFSLYMYVYL